MRKVLSTLAAVVGLGLVAGPAAGQTGPMKVAYINSQKIIAEAPGAKEAQSQFEKDMQGYQAQLKPMADSLQSMIDDYQKSLTVLSPSAKQQKEAAIRAKQQAYQQKEQQLQDLAEKRQQELVQPVMDKIKAVLSDIRKDGGYAMIFDVATPGVVSADTTLDITDQVLARLKATGATAAAPKKP